MKNARKYLLAVCVLAIGFATPVIHAEPDAVLPPKKEPGAKGEPGARLKESLGLTDEQDAKIQAIHADTRAQLQALKKKEGDREAKKEEVKAIRDAAKAKISAILTPEQRVKAEKVRTEMKQRAEERKDAKGAKDAKGEKDGKGPKGPRPAPGAGS